MIRIAAAQINLTVGDLNGNTGKILKSIAAAKSRDCDIVVFPELSICGYPPEDLLLKDHFVKDNLRCLSEIQKVTRGIVAIVGFVDQDKEGRLYNAAAVLKNGKISGVYRKRELPNYGVFDEKRYFVPGKSKGIFSLNGLKIGISICEDVWVEESVCALQAKSGCSLLINLSSSPYDMGKLQEREKLLKHKAVKNKAYIVYVNLVGGQDELVFDGCSLVYDPHGRLVAHGQHFEEDLLVADLPLGAAKEKAFSVKRMVAQRKTVTERVYKALVLGTKDYIQKNGFKKVVIGLSGGIDSALVATVAVDAIGKENVVGVTMPSRYSSSGTQSDARRLAQNLGIAFKELPIEKVYGSYLKSLAAEFKGKEPNVAEENIQARIRGNFLMALSNKFGWLVLTTGNKSEVAVGYCTLYGDMSGGFAVIKDVPKTLVYTLCEWRNALGPRVLIPVSILKRPPTAELRENQKDQDSLPPYPVLDSMLKDYVEDHMSFADMARKHPEDLVKKVIRLVDYSEYKRRQAPPGVKITTRAFGRDWRLPITNKYREFLQ